MILYLWAKKSESSVFSVSGNESELILGMMAIDMKRIYTLGFEIVQSLMVCGDTRDIHSKMRQMG